MVKSQTIVGSPFSSWTCKKEKPQRRSDGTLLPWRRLTSSRKMLLSSSPRPLAKGSASIGHFNNLFSPWCSSQDVEPSFSCVSWNARTLLHHNAYRRAKKIKCFLSFALNSTVVGIQEVHGSEAAFRAAVPYAVNRFHIFSSFTSNPNEAGVVSLFRRSGEAAGAFESEAFIEGRALRVQFTPSSPFSSTLCTGTCTITTFHVWMLPALLKGCVLTHFVHELIRLVLS